MVNIYDVTGTVVPNSANALLHSPSKKVRDGASAAATLHLGALAHTTVARYCQLIRYRYIPFAVAASPSTSPFPAQIDVSEAFLGHIASSTHSAHVTAQALAAMRWYESLQKFAPLIQSCDYLDKVVTGARKRYGRAPVSATTPGPSVAHAIFSFALNEDTPLKLLRVAAIIALITAGCRRKAEILEVHRCDISITSLKIDVFIAKAKCDSFRHGHLCTLARGTDGGAADVVLRFLKRTDQFTSSPGDLSFSSPVFRQMQYSAKSRSTQLTPPRGVYQQHISASTAMDDFHELMKILHYHGKGYTPHAFRALAATAMLRANCGDFEMARLHGVWKSKSIARYVDSSVEELMEPSAIIEQAIQAAATASPVPFDSSGSADDESEGVLDLDFHFPEGLPAPMFGTSR